MATAEPKRMRVQRDKTRRRNWARLLVYAALALALLLSWFWKPLNGRADAGAAYGARVVCSCHYIAGRSLADCRKDFVPGMSMILLTGDAEANSVTARFPLLASQTATFSEGKGCMLEKWVD